MLGNLFSMNMYLFIDYDCSDLCVKIIGAFEKHTLQRTPLQWPDSNCIPFL